MGQLDDLFAPGAAHSTSRVIDFLALKENVVTFELDAVDAYYQAVQSEEIFVRPPKEYLERVAAAGGDTKIGGSFSSTCQERVARDKGGLTTWPASS